MIATISALPLAIFVAGAQAEDLSKSETTKQTLHFAGSGAHVFEVRTIHGSIDIEGYDGDTVEMTVNKSIQANDAEDLRKAQTDVKLESVENAATISAIAYYDDGAYCGEHRQDAGRRNHKWPDYEVRFDFKVRVPRTTKVVVCTINRGDVSVKGTRADFEVRTVNGRIDLADMGGSGEATTVNGPVTASFVVAPRANSLFRTINGDIVLTIPEPFSADLDLKTFNGGLFTDFESRPRPLKAAIAPERKDGKFVYQTNSFATVSVGNGGPLLTLDTFNGDARVLRRAR